MWRQRRMEERCNLTSAHASTCTAQHVGLICYTARSWYCLLMPARIRRPRKGRMVGEGCEGCQCGGGCRGRIMRAACGKDQNCHCQGLLVWMAWGGVLQLQLGTRAAWQRVFYQPKDVINSNSLYFLYWSTYHSMITQVRCGGSSSSSGEEVWILLKRGEKEKRWGVGSYVGKGDEGVVGRRRGGKE